MSSEFQRGQVPPDCHYPLGDRGDGFAEGRSELSNEVMKNEGESLLHSDSPDSSVKCCAPPAALEKLRKVQDFVRKQCAQELVECILMTDSSTDAPLLQICCTRVDPFLLDRATLLLTCHVDSLDQVIGQMLSPCRDMVSQVTCSSSLLDADLEKLLPLIDAVCRGNFTSCQGFNENEYLDLVGRLHKGDSIQNDLIVERHRGSITYRSRLCKYFFEASDPSSTTGRRCADCVHFLGLSSASFCLNGDSSSPNTNPAIEVQAVRRRGRPRKRAIADECEGIFQPVVDTDEASKPHETPQMDTEAAEEKDGSDNDEAKEDDLEAEDHMSMLDDFTDSDYKVYRSANCVRKRITTARQKALYASHKKKRGRPPIVIGPFVCPECDLHFDTIKQFKKHQAEHTYSFVCSEENCQRRFKYQKDLDIHIRKHRGEKPYACQECDKAYQLRQDLLLHLRKHSVPRAFNCEVCGKSFSRSQQLKIHMVVHTKERSFLCTECGNAFGSMSTLIDHRKRKHLLIRHHKCQLCPKAFFSRLELVSHIRTHTGDKPFQCPLCGKCFARLYHLKRHNSSVHRPAHPSHEASVPFRPDFVKEETVLVTPDDRGSTAAEDSSLNAATVLVNAEFIKAEMIVENELDSRESSAQLLLQKLSGGSPERIQYAALTGASSLLELSQVEGREATPDSDEATTDPCQQQTIVLQQDFNGGYLLIDIDQGDKHLLES